MILVLILAVGCFVIRRRRDQPAKRAPVAKDKPRPESMIEHIQLLEEEVEEVDFMGEWISHNTHCMSISAFIVCMLTRLIFIINFTLLLFWVTKCS